MNNFLQKAYLIIALVIGFLSTAQANDYKIIPYPNQLTPKEGVFEVQTAEYNLLNPLTLLSDWQKSARFTYTLNNKLGAEAYELTITPNKISITSATETGYFYAMQSMAQLMTKATVGSATEWVLPCVEIKDSPRFAYRGMHLDVSRHFFDKAHVMRELDAMSRYKLNRFHWHLTDDPGWRIEIKKYPNLTKLAAYRPFANYTDWMNGGHKFCQKNDAGAQGGFYTQEDIKEIVAYAAKRHIAVIPEIEIPGHSEAATYAYPELSCTGKQQSEYCIGNENTFTFIENVLTEVMALFPSEYIHIGGDEVWHGRWGSCAKCLARMKAESFAEPLELQSYTINRIEKFLLKHNRKIIGWDEILLGGLAPQATVMSWQEEVGGIAAAYACHQAIMTPGTYCYLDSYQDAPHTQPTALGGYLPLEKVYSYNPIPKELPEALHPYIFGVQGNVWAELIPTSAHAEYMTYPRLLGIAEIAWTQLENKDYTRFRAKAVDEVRLLESKGYHPFKLYNEVGQRPEARTKISHLGIGKRVIYKTNYAPNYVAGGDTTQVDGWLGDWSYNDRRWQGFSGVDIDLIVDLEQVTNIKEIGAEHMQMTISGVWMPTRVEILLSDDGKNFRSLGTIGHNIPENEGQLRFQNFYWHGTEKARYVRYKAFNLKPAKGWLFIDEVVIR